MAGGDGRPPGWELGVVSMQAYLLKEGRARGVACSDQNHQKGPKFRRVGMYSPVQNPTNFLLFLIENELGAIESTESDSNIYSIVG